MGTPIIKTNVTFNRGCFSFLHIKLHDGCSFQVHDNLQQIYPGRFKKRLMVHVSQGLPIIAALTECIDTIAKLCERAHPKRDLKDELYQFGVISLVNI